MKKLIAIIAALSMTIAAFAQQSKKQAEWVPTHEFHIDYSGGISNLHYGIDPKFASPVQFNIIDALGGYAGLGYTAHITDWFGITTGAEFAIYRGGFSSTQPAWAFADSKEDGTFAAISWTKKDVSHNENGDNIITWNDVTLSEKQSIYSVQVPLMLQFMAPLNAKKSNHFYFALGARFGFNIMGNFSRSLSDAECRKSSGYGEYNGCSLAKAEDVHLVNDAINNIYKNSEGKVINNTDFKPQQMIALTAEQDIQPNTDWEKLSLEKEKGKLNLALFNVLASAELGFRWGLGGGWGLYTGVYFDYGFLPMLKNTGKFFKYEAQKNGIDYSDKSVYLSSGSLLEGTYDDPGIKVDNQDHFELIGDPRRNVDIATKVTNVSTGLKLKLAFGKVKKAAPAPIIEVRRDTLEKIIYVRDTVQNTVVVKDTVTVEKTNTVIIRDTVTIIKEVPVEIQKTMADLSNTMFDFNKSVIKDAAKGPLNTVVKWLQENPKVKVEISGHTDNVGSASYNQRLSEARAKAVYDYFVSQGVDKFRLAYAGYGKDRPIASNDTEEGRQMNRRVELNIVE